MTKTEFNIKWPFKVTQGPDLDSAALNATPDADIPDDPTVGAVRRVIQKLKNGSAGGPDGISAGITEIRRTPDQHCSSRTICTGLKDKQSVL